MLLVLAVFLLALYFAQKGHVEYLWLALHELLQAPIAFFELAGSSARLDSLWYAAVVLQLMLISAYLYFEFLIAFLALRPKKRWVRWYIKLLRYTSPILAGVGPTLLLVGHSKAIGIVLAIVFAVQCLLDSGMAGVYLVDPDCRGHTAAQLRGGFAADPAGAGRSWHD